MWSPFLSELSLRVVENLTISGRWIRWEAMSRRPIFHGWKIVGAGAVIQSLQSGLLIHAFGAYAVVFNQNFGWSKTMLSAGYSLQRAESSLLGLPQGWALDRYGSRRVMRVGVVLLSVGFALFSRINEKWEFFAAVVVMAVGASLSGFLSIVTATVRWFERKRARALSASSVGFALGGAAVVPGIVWYMERAGWRAAAMLSAVLVLVVAWPLTGFFGKGPEDMGANIDDLDPEEVQGLTTSRAEGVAEQHFTLNDALRTRSFWLISFGHASALLVVGAVIAHLALFLTEERDFSLQETSFVTSGLTVSQLLGMIAGGYLGDRWNKRLLASSAMVGHMVGLLILAYASSRLMVWLFVPLHGLAWGVRGPLMQALRADYFGSTHFGQIMGFSSFIIGFGMVGGPLIAGILADTTGSYRTGFVILACMAGAGLFFFVMATPPGAPASLSALSQTASGQPEYN